jgi:hypothetical protein
MEEIIPSQELSFTMRLIELDAPNWKTVAVFMLRFCLNSVLQTGMEIV